MEGNQSSEVYYFWTDSDTNTHGVTIADSDDSFATIDEFTIEELSTITAPENEGGNGEGAAWGDAIASEDGSRLFVNARNADKVVVIDTESREVETILDVGDRPVHSYYYNGEIWVHVDGDGAFNVIDRETLEVSELVEANTVGTGHGKLLVAEGLGNNTYVTNTDEPAVFPINTETREVGVPIEIAGGDPEIGTHDKGYDPATGLAFFQLTNEAGFSFIDAETNEVVLDRVPILGRVAHTPDDNYILILNAEAEANDIGIWNTTLETHTQPKFDSEVTVGGGVSVNGTEFYLDGEDWEAWIPQTEGDNIAILNLSTNEVEYIEVGNLTVPEGARHFSRLGGIDSEYFFTYSDEGAVRIDLDTSEVSETIPLGGDISRMAVVETTEPELAVFEFEANGQIAGFQATGEFSYDANRVDESGIVREEDLITFDISFFDPEGNLLKTYEDNHLTFPEFNFAYDTNTGELLQEGAFMGEEGFNFGEKTAIGENEFTGLNLFSRPELNPFGEVPPPHYHFDDWSDEFDFPVAFGTHEDVSFFTQTTQELVNTGRVGDAYIDILASDLDETGQRIEVFPVIEADLEDVINLTGLGNQTAEISITRNAVLDSTVDFYEINPDGSVTIEDGSTVALGEDSYQEAAIANRLGLDLTVPDRETAVFTAELEGGKLYAPAIVSNGNFASFADDNSSNDPQIFFAYEEANADNFDHINSMNSVGGITFEFEDLFGGGDRDFDDIVVEVSFL